MEPLGLKTEAPSRAKKHFAFIPQALAWGFLRGVKMNTADKLISLLRTKKLSVAVAESCSGGYTSFLLTRIPGSSQVFKGGVVVYSTQAKHKLLKIPVPLLKESQGVSEDIALLLAENVRKLFASQVGAGLVGFAGPATKKGVKTGTVFMAVSFKRKTYSQKLILKGNRDAVRRKASRALIEMVYEIVLSPRS